MNTRDKGWVLQVCAGPGCLAVVGGAGGTPSSVGPAAPCQPVLCAAFVVTVCWWPRIDPQHLNGVWGAPGIQFTATNQGKSQLSPLSLQLNVRSLPSAVHGPSVLPHLLISSLLASSAPHPSGPRPQSRSDSPGAFSCVRPGLLPTLVTAASGCWWGPTGRSCVHGLY